MKWYHAPKPVPGDIRSRRKFLFRPMTIDLETRWLEVATYKEKYVQGSGAMGAGYHWVLSSWI